MSYRYIYQLICALDEKIGRDLRGIVEQYLGPDPEVERRRHRIIIGRLMNYHETYGDLEHGEDRCWMLAWMRRGMMVAINRHCDKWGLKHLDQLDDFRRHRQSTRGRSGQY